MDVKWYMKYYILVFHFTTDTTPQKLFAHISGDIILYVSSKRRRLEARNFAANFIFIPFATYGKTSFTE